MSWQAVPSWPAIHVAVARSARRIAVRSASGSVAGTATCRGSSVRLREDEAGVARARGEGVLVHDREVELGEPQRGEAVSGLEVVDGELEGRVVSSQRRDRRGHERLGRGLERGHAQAAGDDAREPGQVRLGDLELRQHRLGVGDERARGVGQPDAAAVALEQRDPDLALERGELLRDRRRRERERLGGRRDRPAGGEL